MARVLVVEDYPAHRNIYDAVLTMEGHEVDTVVNGSDALEALKKHAYDLILLDMLLPEMNGIEFLKAADIKNNYPNMKVVVFSNIGQPELAKQAIEMGVTKYMLKATYTPKEMAEVVEKALRD